MLIFMQKLLLLFIFLTSLTLKVQSQFDKYFTNQTLRFDYFHTGNAKNEIISPDKILKQDIWAGNPQNCIQPFELGIYSVKLIDTLEKKVIYSKGYNSIFAEYQTTEAAIKGNNKTYHETTLVPYPKRTVKIVIEKRDKKNVSSPIYTQIIDPSDYHISTENNSNFEIIEASKGGNPHNCVDLVILGDGYTQNEREKFKSDLLYYSSLLLNTEPFKKYSGFFNINGIFAPSFESGTDEPRERIYRNTRLNSSFNIFDLDRYCLADDNKSIRDVAGVVPYDAIVIMVNKNRYGGGGIYNWQTIFCVGSYMHNQVFLHEFGHGFAGLADEYYNSSVAYQDMFVEGVEPLEPNITALHDTANVKWKKYLSPGIEIPTEWGKTTFDSLSLALNSAVEEKANKMDKMKKSGASQSQIKEETKAANIKIQALSAKVDSFIFNHPLKDKVGVFEGGNYLSKGYYRPTINSLMHKFDPKSSSYGIVNEQAIISTINYYIEK